MTHDLAAPAPFADPVAHPGASRPAATLVGARALPATTSFQPTAAANGDLVPLVLPNLAAAMAEVERRLDLALDEALHRSAAHTPHYQQLWRAVRTMTRGGKRLRPRLLLATFLHLGGTRLEPAVELAVAVELLHTALLVHDDVIDGDVQRRGVPNVVGTFEQAARAEGLAEQPARRWGEQAALLAGDLLLTSALRIAARLELDRARRTALVELVDESVYRAAAGELADVTYAAGLATPSPSDIRRLMADKTAHYSLELPLRAAAVLAGSPDWLGDRLGAIGHRLGLVFQMRDDLLGVFGSPAETGKSDWNDLREGKQTLLVAHARGTAEWGRVAHLFGREDLDEVGADVLKDALETCGARDRLEREIREERDTALALIGGAGLPDALAGLLADEARRAAERRS